MYNHNKKFRAKVIHNNGGLNKAYYFTLTVVR